MMVQVGNKGNGENMREAVGRRSSKTDVMKQTASLTTIQRFLSSLRDVWDFSSSHFKIKHFTLIINVCMIKEESE